MPWPMPSRPGATRCSPSAIVSNPFGEYLDVSSADSALAGLQRIAETLKAINTGKRRIRFAVGEAYAAMRRKWPCCRS